MGVQNEGLEVNCALGKFWLNQSLNQDEGGFLMVRSRVNPTRYHVNNCAWVTLAATAALQQIRIAGQVLGPVDLNIVTDQEMWVIMGNEYPQVKL